MTGCPHTDLLFDSNVSPYPVCTLCGNGVRIVADTRLHPFDGPRGLKGYTTVVDTDENEIEVQQSSALWVARGADGIEGPFVWLRVMGEFGRSVTTGKPVPPQAHLTPAMAREVGMALLQFAEEASDG